MSTCRYLWGAYGTSRHHVSPLNIFWDPWSPKLFVPETQSPWKDTWLSYCMIQFENVMHNDRDVSMLGHCVSGTIKLGTMGPRKTFGDPLFRDVPSPHPVNGVKPKTTSTLHPLPPPWVPSIKSPLQVKPYPF